jgi:hypothetical protein
LGRVVLVAAPAWVSGQPMAQPDIAWTGGGGDLTEEDGRSVVHHESNILGPVMGQRDLALCVLGGG